MIAHFLQALHDLRYIIAAALLIWAAAWTITKVYGWSCAEVDRMVGEALDSVSLDDLMDGDTWAASNGHAPNDLDAWAAEPLCKGMSDDEAARFTYEALVEIDELTGGAA